MGRKPKTHSDQCFAICICCLQRPKGMKPIVPQNGDTSAVKLITAKVYSDYSENREHLPKSICKNCTLKLGKKESEFQVSVDYKGLVENVKSSAILSESKCPCEICIIASSSINAKKSPFLLQKVKLGISSVTKQPKIITF